MIFMAKQNVIVTILDKLEDLIEIILDSSEVDVSEKTVRTLKAIDQEGNETIYKEY